MIDTNDGGTPEMPGILHTTNKASFYRPTDFAYLWTKTLPKRPTEIYDEPNNWGYIPEGGSPGAVVLQEDGSIIRVLAHWSASATRGIATLDSVAMSGQ